MPDSVTMKLPAMLDFAAAAPLKAALAAERGKALSIDAADVERFGALCLQILAAARAAWIAEERDFQIVNASDAFTSALALMGGAELLGQAA